MHKIKLFINKINPIYMICGYLILLIVLVFFKTRPYNYNLSSLIGIWKGFAELNSNLIDKGFIIYYDGGYDGQFFYLIAKSIFVNGFENFPILDSFYLRFNRLGLSLLSCFFSNLLGFRFYPIITLVLLVSLHIYSFQLLRNMLNKTNKYLASFYLYSPFAMNANLLLVSDSLLVSFSVICIFFMNRIGLYLFCAPIINANIKLRYYLLAFLILTFTVFVKESGLILLCSFFLFSFFTKKFKPAFLIFFVIGLYWIITQVFKVIPHIHPGTNALGFLDLIDYPLLGFYKSIQIQSFINIKILFREFAKFPIFLFYILLLLNLINIKNYRDFILFLPISFTLITAGVGEVGYWLSFDNISRMFTMSIAWIILLKDKNASYNDYYALPLSFFILILLIVRLIYVKSPMTFYVY